jgi:hypothetical protein
LGHGDFDETAYESAQHTRAANNVPDFAYNETATSIHDTLNPHRILNKPFRLLESRDSVDHPISTPIIVTFDVTGSNIHNAKIAQKKLPELMAKLTDVCENPQVAIWANDDAKVIGNNALQLGEFESDNRIDESIRNVWLTNNGGGNGGESYDLLIYAAARKTITDSWEKRHKKGYMFLYADENFFPSVKKSEVQGIFGDGMEADIPIGDIVAEAQEKWNIFVIWPKDGYVQSRKQYEELFGMDHVETLEGPAMLCEKIASMVAAQEANMEEVSQLATASGDYTNRLT